MSSNHCKFIRDAFINCLRYDGRKFISEIPHYQIHWCEKSARLMIGYRPQPPGLLLRMMEHDSALFDNISAWTAANLRDICNEILNERIMALGEWKHVPGVDTQIEELRKARI